MPETLPAEHSWRHWPSFPQWLLIRHFRQTYTVSRQLTEAERYLIMTEAFRWAMNLDGSFAFSHFSPRPDGEGITYWWRTRLVATCRVTQRDRELAVELSYNRIAVQGFFLIFYGILLLLVPSTIIAAESLIAGIRWFLLLLGIAFLAHFLSLAFSNLIPTWCSLLRGRILSVLKGFGLEAEAHVT